jgi:hypothetical protein
LGHSHLHASVASVEDRGAIQWNISGNRTDVGLDSDLVLSRNLCN